MYQFKQSFTLLEDQRSGGSRFDNTRHASFPGYFGKICELAWRCISEGLAKDMVSQEDVKIRGIPQNPAECDDLFLNFIYLT